MHDMVGNELKLGDRVATDITATKSTRLQVGLISAVDGGDIKISYKLDTRSYDYKVGKYVNKQLSISVWRNSEYVVKVAGGV